MEQPSWTDVLTAYGTLGGATATLLAVVVALFFSTQDERRRRLRERRAQAESITGWWTQDITDTDGAVFHINIQNSSQQCVYRMIARLVREGTAERLGSTERGMNYAKPGLIPPGRTEALMKYQGGAANLRFGIEFAFRDAAGHRWIRRSSGALEEIKQDPVALYGFGEPFHFEFHPRRIPND